MLAVKDWTPSAVDGECRGPYRRWAAAHERRYEQELGKRGVRRVGKWVVENRSDLLPNIEIDHLGLLVDPSEWHRHCRSAKSSQTLAVGFFGPAVLGDQAAWAALTCALLPAGASPGPVLHQPVFERAMKPSDLLEHGVKTTSIDLLIETDKLVIAVECKRFESGIGRCSCRVPNPDGPPPKTLPGWPDCACKPDVLGRTAYWRVARDHFGLPERLAGIPCPIALSYQAIRNVAALEALRGDRQGVLVVVYDLENPYFRPTGAWQGWPSMLSYTLGSPTSENIGFNAVSWQELVPLLLEDPRHREWASALHGIT